MKRKYILPAVFLIFSGVFILNAQTVSYTSPETLKSFLPTIKEFRLGLKDMATWSFIQEKKFPLALRTYYKNNQKIIIKITDAHYEPVAYRNYYFYVDLGNNKGGKNDKFSLFKINEITVYVHNKVQQKIMRGIALIGNRYIVEVAVSPAKDTVMLENVMKRIDFSSLAETNNPSLYRKQDFREKVVRTATPDGEY
jgi:hypothetical protein